MQDGRCLRLTAYGRYGVTGTPTLTFALRWGGVAGTVIATSGAIVCGSGVTAAQWKVHALIQVRTNGSAGSVYCQGEAVLHEDAVATAGTVTNYGMVNPMGSAGVATPAAVTVDFSIDKALSLTADWSAASASNTITGHIYALEAMN